MGFFEQKLFKFSSQSFDFPDRPENCASSPTTAITLFLLTVALLTRMMMVVADPFDVLDLEYATSVDACLLCRCPVSQSVSRGTGWIDRPLSRA